MFVAVCQSIGVMEEHSGGVNFEFEFSVRSKKAAHLRSRGYWEKKTHTHTHIGDKKANNAPALVTR